MWLGEQITENGIGNGMSLLIAASIIASIPGAFWNLSRLVGTGDISILGVLLIFVSSVFLWVL